jgi:hypothetical protein
VTGTALVKAVWPIAAPPHTQTLAPKSTLKTHCFIAATCKKESGQIIRGQ